MKDRNILIVNIAAYLGRLTDPTLDDARLLKVLEELNHYTRLSIKLNQPHRIIVDECDDDEL
jgi:hypothetical protein